MKIVSLLPSATEIAFALGLGDQMEGRSFECDHPVEAHSVPIVSGTALVTSGSGDAAAIDTEVAERVAAGESIYTLDDDLIRQIQPDVILAQDLCRVCAVPSGAVEEALDVVGCRAEVVSLDPSSLDEVIAGIGLVGAVTGTEAVAEQLMASLRGRLAAVEQAVASLPRRRVLVLEWADPPFNAGHWVPDMVLAAGGEPVLTEPGARSTRLEWSAVAAADADVVVFAPCGFDLDGAVEQATSLLTRPELAEVDSFWVVDANGLISRPGPRVVDGVETLAALLHGHQPVAPTAARRLR
jgi:iron complex transport system substrate-binding protein